MPETIDSLKRSDEFSDLIDNSKHASDEFSGTESVISGITSAFTVPGIPDDLLNQLEIYRFRKTMLAISLMGNDQLQKLLVAMGELTADQVAAIRELHRDLPRE
jgi:hypothetical protein